MVAFLCIFQKLQVYTNVKEDFGARFGITSTTVVHKVYNRTVVWKPAIGGASLFEPQHTEES